MTSHHDVAGVVAELRIGFDVSPAIAERAAALLESQAKALSEAEDKNEQLQRTLLSEQKLAYGLSVELRKFRDDALAAEARLAEAMRVIEPLLNAKALAGVRALVAGWNGEGRDEPYKERHPYRLGATLPTCCGEVYELDEALTAARAFTNAAKEKT